MAGDVLQAAMVSTAMEKKRSIGRCVEHRHITDDGSLLRVLTHFVTV